jgi:hypothetical protein
VPVPAGLFVMPKENPEVPPAVFERDVEEAPNPVTPAEGATEGTAEAPLLVLEDVPKANPEVPDVDVPNAGAVVVLEAILAGAAVEVPKVKPEVPEAAVPKDGVTEGFVFAGVDPKLKFPVLDAPKVGAVVLEDVFAAVPNPDVPIVVVVPKAGVVDAAVTEDVFAAAPNPDVPIAVVVPKAGVVEAAATEDVLAELSKPKPDAPPFVVPKVCLLLALLLAPKAKPEFAPKDGGVAVVLELFVAPNPKEEFPMVELEVPNAVALLFEGVLPPKAKPDAVGLEGVVPKVDDVLLFTLGVAPKAKPELPTLEEAPKVGAVEGLGLVAPNENPEAACPNIGVEEALFVVEAFGVDPKLNPEDWPKAGVFEGVSPGVLPGV